MPLSEYVQRLVAVAHGEHRSFSGVLETDPRLRSRIYDTYLADLKVADPANSIGWAMPTNIGTWAWSATFVSWCMLAAGARVSEFAFSVRHAIFIKASIANADSERGVFKAREISTYAPQIGDLIVANREGGSVSYAEARTRESYPSHSAIVTELITRSGRKYAVTIGGNERDSVRRTEVPLTAGGFVKQRTVEPYIAIIENNKTGDLGPSFLSTITVADRPLATSLPDSFRRHGTFVYDPVTTKSQYGSHANVAAAMVRAGMSHCWVRIHGRGPHDVARRRVTNDLIAACRAEGIAVAGWGWCQGENPANEATMALNALSQHGLSDYIADIEPGHSNSQWTSTEIADFCRRVRAGVTGGFAVSGFALIDWHEPHLMSAAAPYVDAFAPQIYWFSYPNARMASQFRRPNGSEYRVRIASEYAELCLDRWARLIANSPKPLILTGQAYWGEGGFTQQMAEAKLAEFLESFSSYNRVAGINWWHFGGGEGMSHAMLESIASKDLGNKQYA